MMTASSPTRRALSLASAVTLGLAGVVLIAAPASAATLTVTSPGDTGPGTLSAAIDAANLAPGADTITFGLPGASPTITLATALPEITDSLTITGPTGGIIVDGSGVASGNGLQADACGPVIDLTVTDLTVSGFPGDGIDFECSNVALSRVAATGNGDVGVAVNVSAGGKAVFTDVSASANASNGIRMMTTGAGSETTFTRVTATASQAIGADLATDDGGKVTVVDSHFDANESGGAALTAGLGGIEHISGSTFNGNNPSNAPSIGGLVIASSGGTITIDDSEMSDNHSLFGGGIDVPSLEDGAVVSITHARVMRNTVSSNGGIGGGVLVQAPEGAGSHFTLADSVVSGNSSDGPGGGIYLLVDPGLTPTGGTSILRTTVEGNSGGVGGGIYLEGWTHNYTPGAPAVDITASTISNNTAQEGAGIVASDSSASTPDSLVLVDSSTISGNTGSSGSGGLALFGGGTGSVFRVAHSTIASNSGSNGEAGGIFALTPVNLTLDHTVVAGNGATDVQLDDPTTPLAASWSLVQNPDATTLVALRAGTKNLENVDAELGALADNGGPTLTMLPAETSPLIDAGDPAAAGAPATDQRGSARVVRTIDIGAVEVQGARPTALAATGATPAPLLLGGILLLGAGALLMVGRRRRTA